jgi:hypothetical protein
MTIDRSVHDRSSDDSDDSDEAESASQLQKNRNREEGWGGVRYDQHGNNKVGGRKPNSTTISKHVKCTASIAACFARMAPPKRAHDGTSAPPAAPGAWRTQRW